MEKQIGRVKHYYSHLGVAVLQLDDGIQVGEAIHLRGHTTDFRQRVESLEINKQKVLSVGPGAEVALQLVERVRKGDAVYKVLAEGGGGGLARSIAGAENRDDTQMWKQFRDRTEAGRQLAARLARYANRPEVFSPGLAAWRCACRVRSGDGSERAARCFSGGQTRRAPF